MISIFNKNITRNLNLIKTLNIYSDKVNKKFLMKKLKIDEKTLKNDINTINQKYSAILNINIHNSDIEVKYKKNANIEMFFSCIIKNSSIFKIVEAIFFNDFNTLNDIAKHEFFSITTVYRALKKFNKSVSKIYDFKINRKLFQFEGNEDNIRTFLFHLFREKYSYNEWPFEKYDKEKIIKLQNTFLKSIGVKKFPYIDNEIMTILYPIHIERLKSGHCVLPYLIKENFNTIKVQEAYNCSELKNLFEEFELEFTKENIMDIFYYYLHKDIAFSFLDLIKKTKSNTLINFSIYQALESTYKLSDKFNLKLNNPYELITYIHNANVFLYDNFNSNYIVFDKHNIYISKLQIVFPEFMKELSKTIKKYLLIIKGEVKKCHIEYLIYTVISTWDNLLPQLYKYNKKIKTLVISRFNYKKSISLKNQLEILFPNFLDLHLSNNNDIYYKNIKDKNYELIIADFNIPKSKKFETLYINGNIMKFEVIEIIKKIIKLRFEEHNKLN
ncbi:helix-turn-helix domain-containing protein [Helcococcus ovis]|uniref:helix-turn-helix domain-containing protein n=3 Tax=Helcococcus ovis TaxID=72026 RepID=UPI0014306A16|nr:helix-turn-helix domain-containing protein [Helcococcus ovis]WNZ01090.1 helix-turn-helix domain-containing protein [Helcococcus ovis]